MLRIKTITINLIKEEIYQKEFPYQLMTSTVVKVRNK